VVYQGWLDSLGSSLWKALCHWEGIYRVNTVKGENRWLYLCYSKGKRSVCFMAWWK
jgi:hypothetical protein